MATALPLRLNYNDGGATPAATNITAADMNGMSDIVNMLAMIPTAVKTAAYTAVSGDFVPVNATAGAVTITLPSAPLAGTRIGVAKVDSTSNIVTVARGGTDVFAITGGPTSLVFRVQGQSTMLEYSGGVWYTLANAGAGLVSGILDEEQYITSTAARTLASQTAAQKIFGTPTNGAYTAAVGTYFFDGFFTLSAMSATSGSFGFAIGGTAVLGGQLWQSEANKVATIATAAAAMNTTNVAANTALVTANTNTAGWAHVWGKFRVTTAGTIIPMVSLTVAAAAIVGADSWFRVWPLGASTDTSIGAWT
jgi:hypothetical protein